MNKSVFSMVLVAVLGMCSLNAGEIISQKPVTSLQKQDMELLFGANANSVNIAVLSEEEMKEVQGEGFLVSLGWALGIGGAQYAGCRIFGKGDCSFKFPFRF
ncbi:hypothetical protein [Helicobacter sp. 23-1046]